MAEQLEQAIQRMLLPDNDAIKLATAEIKTMMKDPGAIPVLCSLLSSSAHTQVRQYAAVLLRKQVLKRKQWEAVAVTVRVDIRANLLRVMFEEKEKVAQRSMTQVIAAIAKHELDKGGWPELIQFIDKASKSEDQNVREVGLHVLSTICSTSHEHLTKNTPAILGLCSAALDDVASQQVVFHAVTSLTHLVPSTGSQGLKPWQMLVPKIFEGIKRLASADQDLAADALEIFDELLETEVPIMQPHVQTFVQFCLEMAQNVEIEDKLACKALSLVSAIVRQKKKVVVKLNLVAPILSIVFPIMCGARRPDGVVESEIDDLEEADTPEAVASQVIDTMALHLPAEKHISALMKLVVPALESGTTAARRAAFIALAVSSEGCSEHMKTKHLEKVLLPRVFEGMTNEQAEVRNAAMFALGQFSEHLQPHISKHSATLLPLLFTCLRKSLAENDGSQLKRKDVTRTYYAVELFCENLGKDIVPYLDDLVNFLLDAIDNYPSGEVKELAISAISSTAASAKADLMPYFPRIQASLEKFLNPTEDEELLKVQLQALEALAVLAQTLGEHFRPLALGCVTLGLGLMDKTDDPDLRRCTYGLFAAVSGILKGEMAPYMGTIVPMMLDKMRSVEGMSARLKDEDKEMLALFGNDDDEEEETDTIELDDEDIARVEGLDIQTPFLDEKEDACLALGNLAKNTGALFMPYLEESFKEAFDLLEYPMSDIRKVAATTVGNLCCCVGKLVKENPSLQAGLLDSLGKVVPQFVQMVRTDEEREVAMTVLDSLNEMLKAIGGPVLQKAGDSGPVVLMTMVREVIQRKTKCQQEEDTEDLDDEEAEYDSMLIENAGDLLPTMATIIGGEAFANYFAVVIPDLTKKLRKNAAVSERSFAIGVFAETLEKMGSAAMSFVGRLHPIFVTSVGDEDEEVRNNAVYGLGVLTANGGPESHGHYPVVLTLLTKIMATEHDERVRDNVCGAVCRMISAHPGSVAIGEFLPAVMDRLPLGTDVEENGTVYRCIGDLYVARNEMVVGRLTGLVLAAGRLMLNEEVTDDTKEVLKKFVCVVGQQDPAVLGSVLESCGEPVKLIIQSFFQNGHA